MVFKRTKEILNEDIEGLKRNKQIKIDEDELKKKLKEANDKSQKELEKFKAANIAKATEKNYHAVVRLTIGSGSNLEEIAELGATFGYKEGKQTLKVVNKDNEVIFEEYKPDWQNKFKFLDKETLNDKKADYETELKKFQSGKQKAKKDSTTGMVYYEEDYLAMLRETEQDLAILNLGGAGTYSTLKDGIPVYTFEIIGFFKIPKFHYTDKSILGLPPAPKIVIGQYLTEILYKNFKSDETRAERIILTIFAVVLGVALIGAIAILWKTMAMIGDTATTVQNTGATIDSLMNVSDYFKQLISNSDVTNDLLTKQFGEVVQNKTTIIS